MLQEKSRNGDKSQELNKNSKCTANSRAYPFLQLSQHIQTVPRAGWFWHHKLLLVAWKLALIYFETFQKEVKKLKRFVFQII